MEGYRHLCMYRCNQAVQCLQQLSTGQYLTGWVLCQVGRAFFEMVDFSNAASVFREARKYDPYRLEVGLSRCSPT